MNKVSVYAGDGKLIYSQYDASIDSVISSAIECMFMNGMKDIIDADNQTELPAWKFLQTERGYRVESTTVETSNTKPTISPVIIESCTVERPDYLRCSGMTNEELALAIEKAHELTRTTAPQSPILDAAHAHFKALLAVQLSRAKGTAEDKVQ